MPLYEYECEKCHHRFEKIQKFSDPLEQTCPSCGGRVQKLASSPAIKFKGSGWYITDYARKDQGASGGSASKENTSAAKPADAGGTSTSNESSAATPAPAAAPAKSETTKKEG